jgi:hypothetical protein
MGLSYQEVKAFKNCPYNLMENGNNVQFHTAMGNSIKSPPNDFSARSLSEVRIVAEISTADKFDLTNVNMVFYILGPKSLFETTEISTHPNSTQQESIIFELAWYNLL